MKDLKDLSFATRQIHVGKQKNTAGALCDPVYMTSTFAFDSVEQGGRRFAGEEDGYIYTRLGNPSLRAVEEKLASLEGGEDAAVTASGMGAISSTLWSILKQGDEIVAEEALYGCTFSLMSHGLSEFGVTAKFIDMSDPEQLKKALSDRTRVVYFETPCNPTLTVIDIEETAKIAHAYNPDIKVVVDNTFCTPYIQRPLSKGADIVVHSATKYLNGHGDVIAGAVISDAEFIQKVKMFGMKDMTGSIMSPFNAFLMARGMKTLDIPHGAALRQRHEDCGIPGRPSGCQKSILSGTGELLRTQNSIEADGPHGRNDELRTEGRQRSGCRGIEQTAALHCCRVPWRRGNTG